MTTTQEIENAKRCPFCGGNVDIIGLGKLGLSVQELQLVAEYVKNGTLKDMLTIAEIAMRRLNPEKMSTEFQVNDAMSKLREVSNNSIKTIIKETTDFIGTICRGTEADKIQIIKEYEQKYQPIIESLQKEILNRSKEIDHYYHSG
jgi:hypothetical protein